MILFVDDEERPIKSFMEELSRSNYAVHLETDVDRALMYFRANMDKIQLLVLDIMMPHGESLTADETDNGRRTGVSLFRKFRGESRNLPIIVLTNVSAQPVEEAFADLPRCRFLRKIDYFPFEFKDEAVSMLSADWRG